MQAEIGIVGGTGVLGRLVLSELAKGGHRMRILVRGIQQSPESIATVQLVDGDILSPAALDSFVDGCSTVIHLATALKPHPLDGMQWSANDEVRTVGTANLLRACVGRGTRRLIAQSVAFVHTVDPDAWCDGREPLTPLSILRSAVEMEELLRQSPIATAVLRGGLFYGEGTATSETWRTEALSGRFVLPANASNYVSLIHVRDMARAVAAAVGSAATGTFPVVDDQPIRWSELLQHLADISGSPTLVPGNSPQLPSFRVCNNLTKAAFGWQPQFANFRAGLESDTVLRAFRLPQ